VKNVKDHINKRILFERKERKKILALSSSVTWCLDIQAYIFRSLFVHLFTTKVKSYFVQFNKRKTFYLHNRWVMHINIIQVYIWNSKKYISWFISRSSCIRCSRQKFLKSNIIRREDMKNYRYQLMIMQKASLYNKTTYFIVDFFFHIYQNWRVHNLVWRDISCLFTQELVYIDPIIKSRSALLGMNLTIECM